MGFRGQLFRLSVDEWGVIPGINEPIVLKISGLLFAKLADNLNSC